ncbi:hypothetical protein [Asaia krungthepensis]|uniref:Right handed beta helix domain-containing protein n=1 Tax=Asaia krungthepensis NRIC 0535 TaxID=1307925 RepID=A0ABQ0Q4X5_9PROT|nr:hypothetical protein [Asaia krungthepensis]GBQ91493.1 hypothetical protein AA0535_2313 [Asaia krungthepensis NRIC 0535]
MGYVKQLCFILPLMLVKTAWGGDEHAGHRSILSGIDDTPGRSYIDRTVPPALAAIKKDPSLIGYQAVYSRVISVCRVGCDYTEPTSAYNAAVLQAHMMYGNNHVEVKIGDGSYNLNHNFVTSDAATSRVHIVGNQDDPTRVVLNFTNTKGKNLTAFLATSGGIFGLITGVTITQPADGSGAMASTDLAGRHLWNPQSYGAGVGAYGGGVVVLGKSIVIRNFYYSIVADNNGFIDVPNGNGVFLHDAGDVNAMARGGGTIVCLKCHASGASDYTDPKAAILGSSFDAERGGTLYIDGSTSEKTLEAGVLALSGGAAWAQNMTISKPLGRGPGALISGFSSVNLGGTKIFGYYIGVNAQYGFVDVSHCTIDGSGATGIVADGGRVTGSSVTIMHSKQFGIQAIHQGNVVLFDTFARMLANGTNFAPSEAGVQRVSGSRYGASSIDVQ